MKIVPGLILGFIFITIGYVSGWKMQNSEGKYHHMTGLDENEKTYIRKMGAYGSILCGFGWIIHGSVALIFSYQPVIILGKLLLILGILCIVIPYIKFDRWL